MSSDFATKYYSQPEYKQKHNNYMCEKIMCQCGVMTARANMSKHRKTMHHLEYINKNDKVKQLEEENKKLTEQLKKTSLRK